jgi:hypothetical protein
MKNLLLVIVLLLSVSINLLSQQRITGDVYDNETEESLIGATVLVRSNRFGTATTTNANGLTLAQLPMKPGYT